MRLLSSIFSRAGLSYKMRINFRQPGKTQDHPAGPDEISYQLRWSKTHIPPFGGNHSVWERRNTQNEWNHRLNKFGRNDKKTPPPNQRLLGHGHHGLVPRKGIQGHHSQNKARRQSKPHGLTLHGETGQTLVFDMPKFSMRDICIANRTRKHSPQNGIIPSLDCQW